MTQATALGVGQWDCLTSKTEATQDNRNEELPEMNPPLSAANNDHVEAAREQLAQDLGLLLALHWLETINASPSPDSEGPPPSRNPDKNRFTTDSG